jgi:hypothetical protein
MAELAGEGIAVAGSGLVLLAGAIALARR